ncbi:MAG: PepSY domain-containing protein [Cellvibrionaceae bacterium]|nr:PepSY domain-containing protein [Cellvibrionaceae bacterium]
MKKDFRHSMTWLHTWAGLVFCWILYFVFITGSLGYFDNEIDHWMKPELEPASSQNLKQELDLALAYLNRAGPGAERWFISPPNHRSNPQLRVSWRYPRNQDEPRSNGRALLDIDSGQALEARDTGGGQALYRMHYRLHYLPRDLGFKLVGIFTFAMFIALITGIIAHRKLFKDFFTFRPQKGKAAWLDLHNLTSIASLPFQLMITYSGLIFVITTWMPLVALSSYEFDTKALRQDLNKLRGGLEISAADSPAPLAYSDTILAQLEANWASERLRFIEIKHPGDANAHIIFNSHVDSPGQSRQRLAYRMADGSALALESLESPPQKTRDVFINLHEGLFASIGLRWLYFLSGLLGALMVATGAVYYSQKRSRPGHAPSRAQRSIMVVNIGTLAGLPLAIGGYFIANRLLPLAWQDRADWEMHCLFGSWLLSFGLAALVPPARAWVSLLGANGAVFLALPIISALSTERGLANSFASGDWVRFYFELSCIGYGLLAALGASYLWRKQRAELAPC